MEWEVDSENTKPSRSVSGYYSQIMQYLENFCPCADLHPDSSKGENYYKITGFYVFFSCEVVTRFSNDNFFFFFN